jgi:hypothetical protein
MLVLHQFTSSHHRDVTGAPQRSSFQVGGIREVRAPRIVNGLPGLVSIQKTDEKISIL